MNFEEATKNKKMGSSRKMKSYYKNYDFHFSRLDRKKKYRILEIGVQNGGGLWTLKEYFPNSSITGLDINVECKQYESKDDDVEVFIGDQSDEEVLNNLHHNRGPFDIILDDGGHTMEQQVVSFSTLFQLMNDTGIYIIEDLHTSYWPEFGGGTSSEGSAKDDTMMALLRQISDKSTSRWASRCGRAIEYGPVDYMRSKYEKQISTKDIMLITDEDQKSLGEMELDDAIDYLEDGLKGFANPNQLQLGYKKYLELDYCDEYVDSVHFHDSICFVYKKHCSNLDELITNHRQFFVKL